MAYSNNDKFELLDKVIYRYVDYNKPVKYAEGYKGCSGAASPLDNSEIQSHIERIVITTEKYFTTGDEYEDSGFHEYTTTNYYIFGYDKPIQAHQLFFQDDSKNKISFNK